MPSTDIVQEFDSIEDTIQAFSVLHPDPSKLPPIPTLLHTSRSLTSYSPPTENGEFIIVLDDFSRENEGDLIIAASDITPSKMAFMIRHTSGLICTPMASSLTTHLSLPLMVPDSFNEDPNRTAYTVSVDANSPEMTTGISAHDRALTCRMLASPDAKKEDFRRPGHVFPLRAREGGVRERGGHTEAAVEFCRLAGKEREVGVICEMVEDGEEDGEGGAVRVGGGMMRRDGCLAFGRRWGLRVCTIEDLVAYVERTEGKWVKRVPNGTK